MFPFNLTWQEQVIAIVVMLSVCIGIYDGNIANEEKEINKQRLVEQCNRYHPEYKCALMFKDYK